MIALIALLLAAPPPERDYSKVEIKTVKVAGNVYVLYGAGGNIGATVGDDGVAIIDDQFAPLSPKIHAALAKLSPKPVRFLINTHWHFDHTGGNALFSDTAAILAHENVRKRLIAGANMMGMEIKPAPAAALPMVTFQDGLSLWWNGEEIRAIHPGPGHTDGDTVVWFVKSNVVHFGDDFFTTGFPFVDLQSGGSVIGLVKSLDVIIGMVPGDAKAIPGHGDATDMNALKKFRTAIDQMVEIVRKGLAAGKSVEQLQKEHALAEWEPTWDGKDKFIHADAFIATIAQDLQRK
ncbi:MAG TPA: MBL fold metallo-hydrolase [Myxococcales bacterium]|nr:MBL fold metallo-hydrolase [Myxococcales bacterium]